MKKANQIINSIMGAFIGVFIGHSIYVIWNYKTHPELYAMQSAPWYTNILVYGMFALVIIAVGILLKMIMKRFSGKKD